MSAELQRANNLINTPTARVFARAITQCDAKIRTLRARAEAPCGHRHESPEARKEWDRITKAQAQLARLATWRLAILEGTKRESARILAENGLGPKPPRWHK